jgi:hypothetical protein
VELDELAACQLTQLCWPIGPIPKKSAPFSLVWDRRIRLPKLVDWKAAAGYKLNKFESLGFWEPVNPYKGVKALGARWVFTIKQKPNGTIDKFCTSYVAKGFNHVMGTD